MALQISSTEFQAFILADMCRLVETLYRTYLCSYVIPQDGPLTQYTLDIHIW